jgi:hypothetical protein
MSCGPTFGTASVSLIILVERTGANWSWKIDSRHSGSRVLLLMV